MNQSMVKRHADGSLNLQEIRAEAESDRWPYPWKAVMTGAYSDMAYANSFEEAWQHVDKFEKAGDAREHVEEDPNLLTIALCDEAIKLRTALARAKAFIGELVSTGTIDERIAFELNRKLTS